MNAQLTIQDLAGMLADSAGKDRLTAELFLREFITLLQESLLNDDVVKVDGLGVFGVETKENPETQSVVKRLYFIPDENFLSLVNKPFSFFEKVEITDGSLFEDLDRVKVQDTSIYESSSRFIMDKHTSEPEEVEKQEAPDIEVREFEEKPLQKEKTEEIMQENKEDENIVEEKNEAAQLESENKEEEVVTSIEEPEEKEPVAEVEVPKIEPKEVKKHHKTHRSSHRRHKRHNWSKILGGILGIVIVVGFMATVILLPRYKRMRRIAEAREYYMINSADTLFKQKVESSVVVDSLQVADTLAAPVKTEEVKAGKEEKKSEVKKEQTVEKKSEVEKKKVDVEKKKQEAPKTGSKILDTIKIKPGDLMTKLSLKYYGHKYFWVYIYLYNKDHIKDPNNVPIGTQLRIPAPELYGIDSKNPESRKKAAAIQSRILKGEDINLSEIN